MRIGHESNRPPALMLSHCVPSQGGPPDRRRAWQLLHWLTRSHRVYLACVSDGPMHQRDWRAAYLATQRLAIEPAHAGRRMLARAAALADTAWADRLRLGGVLSDHIVDWEKKEAFDAAVRTHPALVDVPGAPASRVRVTDLRAVAAARFADTWADEARRGPDLALVADLPSAHAVRKFCEYAIVQADDAPPDAWAQLLLPRPIESTTEADATTPALARAA